MMEALFAAHAGQAAELLETHISYVLLCAERAYKFKKPIDLGFLDYSTLAKRKRFCALEVELNRRTAPALYLGVIAVRGTPDAPVLEGEGPIIDYAVEMRRFAQADTLDALLAAHEVSPDDMTQLARDLARVHAHAPVPIDPQFGSAELLRSQIEDACRVLLEQRTSEETRARTARIRAWAGAEIDRHAPAIERRRTAGCVKECHGDLHATNVVRFQGRLVPFDCIEFNDSLRAIDTVSEIAFLVMDLDYRDERPLANVFLNAYLEAGGDYGALALLLLHLVYRSLVRAEVALLRSRQMAVEARETRAALARAEGHLRLGERYLRAPDLPSLLLMHGLSGSGKSFVSQRLVEALGFVRIRSDLERKRLQGLPPFEPQPSPPDTGLYAPDQTQRTYARLLELAETVLASGQSVIVDATFLRRVQRRPFTELARRLRLPFRIVVVNAPVELLRERLRARALESNQPSDADLAVLERQIATREALHAEEREFALDVTSGADASRADLLAAVRSLRPATRLPDD